MELKNKVVFLGMETRRHGDGRLAFINFCDDNGATLQLMTGKDDMIGKVETFGRFQEVELVCDVQKKGKESDVYLKDVNIHLGSDVKKK